MTPSTTLTPETHVYKTVGSLPIHADVYRLPGDDIRPAIFYVHGGALIMGARNPSDPEQFKKYLDAGYVVVSIDYRLAPETKLPAIIEDLVDAYAWFAREGPKRFRVDASRVAVMGHSAGGYLSLMAGFRCRPRAVVSFYGYGDLVGGWLLKPDPYYNTQPRVEDAEAYALVSKQPITQISYRKFYLYCRQKGIWPREVAGFDPSDTAAFKPYCPLHNVTPQYPPTLLLHGDIDTDVPYAQSVLMAYEFQRKGVPHELHTVVGEGHGFADPAAIKTANEKVMSFLARYLQP